MRQCGMRDPFRLGDLPASVLARLGLPYAMLDRVFRFSSQTLSFSVEYSGGVRCELGELIEVT